MPLGPFNATLWLWWVAASALGQGVIPSACLDDCFQMGLCTERDGACLAESDQDCAKGWTCSDSGECTARDGACVVATDDDCGRSERCTKDGACSVRDGRCEVTSPEDCLRSERCTVDGLCSFDGSSCVRERPESCAASLACLEHGKCGFERGTCVTTPEGCRASTACSREGRCTHQQDACVATDDADCAGSVGCSEYGYCGLWTKPGSDPVFYECAPRSDDDCAASSRCATHGDCSRHEGPTELPRCGDLERERKVAPRVREPVVAREDELTPEAVEAVQDAGVRVQGGIAATAGGVPSRVQSEILELRASGQACSSTAEMRHRIQDWAHLGWDSRVERLQRFHGIEVALSRVGPPGCLNALGDLTTDMASALTTPVGPLELPTCVSKDEGWRCREASKKTLGLREVEPDRFDLGLYAEHATFARAANPIWWPRWVLQTAEPHETMLDGRMLRVTGTQSTRSKGTWTEEPLRELAFYAGRDWPYLYTCQLKPSETWQTTDCQQAIETLVSAHRQVARE